MKYVAVIDTNVLVSAELCFDSKPGKILQYIKDGSIIPAYSNDILAEYVNVLTRNKFPFKKENIDELINLIKTKGIVYDKTISDESFTDQSDVKFYEITLTANKALLSYLITGNKKHFPKRFFIVTPAEMIEIIENNLC